MDVIAQTELGKHEPEHGWVAGDNGGFQLAFDPSQDLYRVEDRPLKVNGLDLANFVKGALGMVEHFFRLKSDGVAKVLKRTGGQGGDALFAQMIADQFV